VNPPSGVKNNTKEEKSQEEKREKRWKTTHFTSKAFPLLPA